MPTPDPQIMQQAKGYVQLLMQEGKLEEEIIKETCALFQLNKAEAARLIYEYKTNNRQQYKENVSANIKQRLLMLIPLLFFGLVYIVLTLESKSNLYIPIIVLLVLSSIGLLTYCIKLFSEKFNPKRILKLATPATVSNEKKESKQLVFSCFIMITIAIIFTGRYIAKTYLFSDAGLEKTSLLILDKNCTQQRTRGKGSYTYYAFHFAGYHPVFRWRFDMHYNAFTALQMPDEVLKKGDTISVYAKPKVFQSNDDYEFIADIEQHGKRWINQSKRNQLAKTTEWKSLLFIYALFGGTVIVAGLHYRFPKKKN